MGPAMVRDYKGRSPRIDPSCFVDGSAQVIGDVEIGADSSVWFNTVIRGDIHFIQIGRRTNLQDLSVIHVTRDLHPVKVGDDVTVGHRVVLHGCTIGNRVLVGIGSVVMDGVEIGDDCVIGAGSLVTPGTRIPPGSLALGSPARVKRPLTVEEREWIRSSAENYVEYARDYRGSC